MPANTIRPCKGAKTSFAGPTDHRGSRIIVVNLTSGKRKIVSWKYELDSFENHVLAAREMLGDQPMAAVGLGGGGIGLDGGGYVFVVTADMADREI